MNPFSRFARRLRALFRKDTIDADMSEEMQLHLELQTEENIAAGMSPEDARYAALRQFGHIEGIKEQCRDRRGWGWWHDLVQDFRYALRQFRKAPGFAAVTILTIAIGIGACIAPFSIVNTVLLRPIPYTDSQRLVLIYETRQSEPQRLNPTSVGLYFDLLEQSASFSDLSAYSGHRVSLTTGNRSLWTTQMQVTPNRIAMCGIPVLLGRSFAPADGQPGRNHVAILSEAIWQTEFGADPGAINQQIELDGQSYTIVGVTRDPDHPSLKIITTPFDYSSRRQDYGHKNLAIMARLKPQATVAQAREELADIVRRSAITHPEFDQGRVVALSPLLDTLVNPVHNRLLVLLGAGGFLLLIACLNVANLLLARSSARQKELSIRNALGAGRARLIRQLLGESLLITMIGGSIGALIAFASTEPLARITARSMPRTYEGIAVDGTVLAVTGGLVLLASLLISLVPAYKHTQPDAGAALRDSGPTNSTGNKQYRLRTALVVVEIALALILLTGTGLLYRSLRAMQTFDQGVCTRHVYGNQFHLKSSGRYGTPEKVVNFTDLVLARVQARANVAAAAMTTGLPMGNTNAVPSRAFALDDTPPVPGDEPLMADFYKITPQYFDVMSIPLIDGRTFNDQDRSDSPPVAIVNREMVWQHFPNRDPIGQRVMTIEPNQPGIWRTIVGVVGNVKPRGPTSATGPQIYIPFVQAPASHMTLVLRTMESDSSITYGIPDLIHTIDPDIKFKAMYDYKSAIAHSWAGPRFNMDLFGLFSLLALLLAAIGIYGVMAYMVDQRRHEIGIRMALGALPRDIMRMILIPGARIIVFGVCIGTTVSLVGVQLMAFLLFQTSPYDLVTYVAITLLLSLVAVLACWLPARRATKVDPMVAIRCE